MQVATEPVPAEEARNRVLPWIARTQEEYRVCPSCGLIYGPGTHVERMKKRLERMGVAEFTQGPLRTSPLLPRSPGMTRKRASSSPGRACAGSTSTPSATGTPAGRACRSRSSPTGYVGPGDAAPLISSSIEPSLFPSPERGAGAQAEHSIDGLPGGGLTRISHQRRVEGRIFWYKWLSERHLGTREETALNARLYFSAV